jgi:hypothetical protein
MLLLARIFMFPSEFTPRTYAELHKTICSKLNLQISTQAFSRLFPYASFTALKFEQNQDQCFFELLLACLGWTCFMNNRINTSAVSTIKEYLGFNLYQDLEDFVDRTDEKEDVTVLLEEAEKNYDSNGLLSEFLKLLFRIGIIAVKSENAEIVDGLNLLNYMESEEPIQDLQHDEFISSSKDNRSAPKHAPEGIDWVYNIVKKANLADRRTAGVQTDERCFRFEESSQVYLLKESSVNTKKEKSTQSTVKKRHLVGANGVHEKLIEFTWN